VRRAVLFNLSKFLAKLFVILIVALAVIARSAATWRSRKSGVMDRHASLNGMDAPASYRHQCAKVWGVFNNPLKREGASTMKVTTIGLDLAKDVFQICAADANGKILYNKQLQRPLLGAQAPSDGSPGQTHAPAVRQALRQNAQERCC
jgi:hypothetical protein